MKVVVRSRSLLFTVLSIVLHVPISRVKRKANGVVRKPVARVEVETVQESKHWNRVAL
jgi:hypothetical protein